MPTTYVELLDNLVAKGVHFVIRLRLGSHPPVFLDKRGRRVDLMIFPEQEVIHDNILCKGEMRVQLIGWWKRGFARPLWGMTSLQPRQGLDLYLQRMKIEEGFRDLKSLLGLHKVMNKSQQNMEQMVALLMIASATGLLIGEAIRDQLFAETANQPQRPPTPASLQQAVVNKGKKRKLYSGLFILVKQKIRLSAREIRRIVHRVLESFVPGSSRLTSRRFE